jgi:hypothetical protein
MNTTQHPAARDFFMVKSIIRTYQLTDDQVDVIFDRLSRFREDEDAQAVGNELSRQQLHNPNHTDETLYPTK